VSNRELPMMPWYPDQFSAATSSWTWVERAIYRALLDAQWATRTLPHSPNRLARICGMDVRTFRRPWETVKAKFQEVAEGGLQNYRLEQHRIAAFARKQAIAEAGRAGGLAKAQRRSSGASSDARATLVAAHKPPSPSEEKNQNSVPPESLPPGQSSGFAEDPRSGKDGKRPEVKPEELRERVRVLSSSGLKAGDIARTLSQYHLSVAQVRDWLDS